MRWAAPPVAKKCGWRRRLLGVPTCDTPSRSPSRTPLDVILGVLTIESEPAPAGQEVGYNSVSHAVGT